MKLKVLILVFLVAILAFSVNAISIKPIHVDSDNTTENLNNNVSANDSVEDSFGEEVEYYIDNPEEDVESENGALITSGATSSTGWVAEEDDDGVVQTIQVQETELVKLNVQATDPDGNVLTYSFGEPLSQNGEWQTDYGDAGTYFVDVTVSDGEASTTQKIKIIVLKKDRAPVIGILNKGYHISEGSTLVIDLNMTDLDGDEVELSADNLPENASLDDGIFIWIPSQDLIQRSSVNKFFRKLGLNWFNAKKEYIVTFKAVSEGLETVKDVKIVVEDGNIAPVLEEIEPITVQEGQAVWFSPFATDGDGDFIKYSYSGDISRNGWQTNYDSAKTYYVTITASDGFLSDSKRVEVTVQDVNRAPELNVALKSLQTVYENESIIVVLSAFDVDGNPVGVDVENGPVGSELVNGTFTWTPGFDFVSKVEGEKKINLSFVANDGKTISVKGYEFTIKNKNRAPQILNSSPPEKIISGIGAEIPFEIDPYDIDGDNMSISWKFGLLSGEKFKDFSTEHIRTFTSAGKKKVTVFVSDGESTVSHSWYVKIIGGAAAPEQKQELVQEEAQKESEKTGRTVIYDNKILTNANLARVG